MIWDSIILSQSGQFIIKEPPSSRWLRPLMGLLPFAFGHLVIFGIYLILFGHGPAPAGGMVKRILGWIVLAILFGALGIPFLVLGTKDLFVRHSYALHQADRMLELHFSFVGVPVSTRWHGFSAFERVTVRAADFGHFAKMICFVVACDGSRRLDLSAFNERNAAVSFANDIAGQMGLPVAMLNL